MGNVVFFLKTVRWITVVIATTVIVSLLTSCSMGQVNIDEQIHSRAKNIQQSMDHPASWESIVSSGLHEDLIINKDFEAIVALGVAALPELIRFLEHSDQDIFIEYIYALALERISKVDLKKEMDWHSRKEFLTTYKAYLKEIPNKVQRIADEPISDTKKNDQLKALGAPAIPYLFDVIDNGHQELSPAFNYLTNNESKGDIQKWGIDNVDQLNLLINFVEMYKH
ncbi:hypothetical protein MKY92_15140 [Paenibacillus sp. FSL R5-0623]|uniref:hypothetical protein n=1 Tax=Paenibacillus sp. FSL R5-0623 TaxID=2921651 RepID=UPI0030DA7891